MKIKLLALVCVSSIVWSSSFTGRAQSQPNPWSAMALLDLQGIHDILRDNHPGPVDPENSRYAKWLEDGLAQASQCARSVRSYSDYTRVLRFYTNGFQDGHLGVGFDISPREVRWPGFIIGPDDDGAAQVIYAEADAGVPLREHLLTCDGKSVDELMKERVDPYYWNSAIPHQRPLHFYRLFQIDPNDHAYTLKSCRFSSGEVKLKWRGTGRAEFQKLLDGALGRKDRELLVKQVNGVWFIRVPTFAFMGEAEVKKVRAFISDLRARATELRKSLVVFDVRGNRGGNSAWAGEIAATLWGHDWVKYIEDGFDGTVDWRPSPANIKWLEYVVGQQKKAGLAEAADYWQRAVAAMKAAGQGVR